MGWFVTASHFVFVLTSAANVPESVLMRLWSDMDELSVHVNCVTKVPVINSDDVKRLGVQNPSKRKVNPS